MPGAKGKAAAAAGSKGSGGAASSSKDDWVQEAEIPAVAMVWMFEYCSREGLDDAAQGLLASARKYNSALVNEEMLHQVADPYMQLRRLIKRNEFEKVLQEFEWICPQEMPKQQGTVFDKTLNAIRVQTALNPLRVSIAREEEFHTKVEKLLVPKNLGKEGKEIRRKLLAAKTEDARRELLLEFDEGWFENQLKMFWRELQKFLPRTSLEDAIMRSGGAAPSSLPPPESFTAAKAKSRNGDQPAPAPASAVLPVQAPAKAPASAQAPAAAPQRSTNLTPWQLKRLTLRIIESGRGVSKNAGVHETFVDMYQQATKEVKELLARRPLGDGSAADTKQEAASAKVDAATEKPKSSRAGAPLRAQPVAAKAPAASKATTVLPLASKPAAPSATTSGKDKEPAPVTQEPTASPPPQKRKRAQPVEDTDSDSDEDAMPPPTRGRRAAASAAAGAGAAANKENTQPAAPAASAIQALARENPDKKLSDNAIAKAVKADLDNLSDLSGRLKNKGEDPLAAILEVAKMAGDAGPPMRKARKLDPHESPSSQGKRHSWSSDEDEDKGGAGRAKLQLNSPTGGDKIKARLSGGMKDLPGATAALKKIPWTPAEEKNLRAGVDKYGKGKWKQIRQAYEFNTRRTAVDLKDKWRILEGRATGVSGGGN